MEKQGKFDNLCLRIFEELVILSVDMELLGDVCGQSGQMDTEKFKLLTAPRSAGTGVRYAQLVWTYVEKMSHEYSTATRPAIFGVQAIQTHIHGLIGEETGFMTPLSFIYAVEHFATVFGFDSPGTRSPRCRRFALDYSKKAPEKRQAPSFTVSFLDYMERYVLDQSKPMVYRLTIGKLRLCTQASVRHADLASTALERVEWCRVIGEDKVLGLRAKASKTKSGPRPWSASWLGVRPENDDWLFTFVKILIMTHGPAWRSHGFLGCAHDGKGSFGTYPPSIGEDVILVQQALEEDRESGAEVPLTKEECMSLRWHSCKNTLPTLMVHLGIRTRSIRHQGAWRKASESMVDLYLRETQVLVIKAQLEVLDQLRRGATLNILEGKPMDDIPSRPGWGPPESYFRDGLPSGLTVERATAAMDAASVCRQDEGDGEPKVREDRAKLPSDLPDIFKEPEMYDKAKMEEKLVSENVKKKVEMDLAVIQEIEKEVFQGEVSSSGESDDEEARPEEVDLEMYPHFVVSAKGSGKVHKPSSAAADHLSGVTPKCGVRGRDYSELDLDENWGKYSPCSRCFGRSDGCHLLCSYMVMKKGKKVRCGRRCVPEAVPDHVDEEADSGLTLHRCSFHGTLVSSEDL